MDSDSAKKTEKKTTNEKPISLQPLDFDEAMRGLLEVKPPTKADETHRKNSKSKKTT